MLAANFKLAKSMLKTFSKLGELAVSCRLIQLNIFTFQANLFEILKAIVFEKYLSKNIRNGILRLSYNNR